MLLNYHQKEDDHIVLFIHFFIYLFIHLKKRHWTITVHDSKASANVNKPCCKVLYTISDQYVARVYFSNSQQYTAWVNIIIFSFMPKIIRILSKDHVPFPTLNISKLDFGLVI